MDMHSGHAQWTCTVDSVNTNTLDKFERKHAQLQIIQILTKTQNIKTRGEREREREERREGEREGEREGGKEGGREGGRERGRKGGRKRGREKEREGVKRREKARQTWV